MIDFIVVLGPLEVAEAVAKAVSGASATVQIKWVDTLERLEEVSAGGAENPLLVSAETGVIVPRYVLNRFPAGAINFHGASPAYPGRDPHHFAAYDQCNSYGATAHVMIERVDEGPILDVEEEPVEPGAHPDAYLATGKRCLMRLVARVVPRLITGEARPVQGLAWRGNKTSRRDFQSLCRIDPLSDDEEIERRVRATEMPGYANAHVDIAGYRFRIEGPAPRQTPDFRHFEEDFTEVAYIKLLDRAAKRYRFIGFDAALTATEPSVLWRHDIDFSVHRARRLASLEAERGLRATYFVLPGCSFYNMFEAGPRQLLREIVSDGHHIGLHFDPTTLAEKASDQVAVENRIVWEAGVLRCLIGESVVAVSIHNPSPVLPWLMLERLGGLINVYGAALGERYSYVSDSNGIWRHRRLMDALVQDGQPYLHVLTHPAWWVPEPMPARTRVRRAVEGRARRVMGNYDRELARYGRPNVQ